MVNRLTLVPGESETHGLRYWDLAVDGRLLRDSLVVGDYAPVFVLNWPGGMPREVLVLLGERPSELSTGRVPIFVCPVCGDLGCGSMTVAVDRSAETVVWREFGWETDYVVDEDDEDNDQRPGGPFTFARDQYEGELRRFLETFDDVQAATASAEKVSPDAGHRRRRRRWAPW